MSFIHDNFLLTTKAAQRLYHQYAAAEPILDYHCHLTPRDIAENRRFANLTEIWLEGDHYKWRAMRASGADERYCTGNASPWEKFLAWSRTVPKTLRNPLYHWTHLELKRYFGIDDLLDENTAPSIWERANAMLAGDDLTACAILAKFRVNALCTTDDPADDLSWHKQIAASELPTRVFPTFRPDQALNVHLPGAFNSWVSRLEAASGISITGLPSFLDALRRRHDYFHSIGCRISDHGLSYCYSDFCPDHEAAAVFEKTRSGKAAGVSEQRRFASYMMLFFGRLDAEKGWTKQLHLSARRNANSRKFQELGPDVGFDSIGDWPQVDALGAYLDALEKEDALPKTIVYNLNPASNYGLATIIGNFQGGGIPGKLQYGSGWWFLDQKEGMEWQINALSSTGLLSRFVGMLTDSRSYMSYPRHEYFRRVLCNLVGRDMENGEIPDSDELAGTLVRNICYRNALEYLGLPL
ncbi:MAG: glucuronate isomerase [Bryobacteraceae bacterium]